MDYARARYTVLLGHGIKIGLGAGGGGLCGGDVFLHSTRVGVYLVYCWANGKFQTFRKQGS